MAKDRKPRGPIAIDEQDVHLLYARSWHRSMWGYPSANETTASARARGALKPTHETLHRVIMSAPKGMQVDHINGDILDNRRCNLRFATRKDNTRNRRTPPANSGYRGVRRTGAYDDRFKASITINNRAVHLGTYDSAEEAAAVYDAAARKHFGEFARLNFPQGQERAA